MQALTLAIGPEGVKFFTRWLVNESLMSRLQQLKPPGRTINLPNFDTGASTRCRNLQIVLSNSRLDDFRPSYQGVTQGNGGKFSVGLKAVDFAASYNWRETWQQERCTPHMCYYSDMGPDDYQYRPLVASLKTSVTLGFAYRSETNTYDVTCEGIGTPAVDSNGDIPGGSILNSGRDCYHNQAKDEAANALKNIDFTSALNGVMPKLIKSIAASGELVPGLITYDFAVGDSGVTFPDNDQGIRIGVTGRVAYQGTWYPGAEPPNLPVPTPPGAGGKHLRAYVSDYEINALHWAYFNAKRLNRVVKPGDPSITNPDVLKVKTYARKLPSLQPYDWCTFRVEATPLIAPVAAFQKVWHYTKAVMDTLATQLPEDVVKRIQGLGGEVFAERKTVVDRLIKSKVPAEHHSKIADTAETMGMVISQDVRFKMVIQEDDGEPDIIFRMKRTNCLVDLGLGRGTDDSRIQTMKYRFHRVSEKPPEVSFVSSTVPGFEGQDFGGDFWDYTGETAYAQTLDMMGQNGVPLPIMDGFGFRFDDAKLRIQTGYVEIDSNIEFVSRRVRPAPGTDGRRSAGTTDPAEDRELVAV
ncbi:hypothetical protein [Streptomyces sp. NPDC051162]|uniref:hypothetical protein n=1 Tax=unclassified Streptomyces TaxID=2593676 RepID=UPI00342E7F2A